MVLHNFWVLEGLDGSGTTTQLNLLKIRMEKLGIRNFITAEPTSKEIGKLIREVLSGKIKFEQSTIAHLFSADRDDHLNNSEYGILKHIESGEIVVSDRYFFSSLAYQSIGFDFEQVKELNKDFPFPEILIFIDTKPEDCIKRINKRGMEKEIFEKLSYQKKVYSNYKECLKSLPAGCRLLVIDGNLSIEEIANKINEFCFN